MQTILFYFQSNSAHMQRNERIAIVLTVLAVLAICFGYAYASNDSGESEIEAKVLSFDAFGNAHFDLVMDDFRKIGADYGDDVRVTLGNQYVSAVLTVGYTGIACYEVFIVVGEDASMGAFNYDFLKMIELEIGDVVTITKIGRNPYVDFILKYQHNISMNRDDYPSDEAFGNYRMVDVGQIEPDTLYRSASPWKNGVRAEYVDNYYREQGVECLIGLDADYDEIKKMVEEHPDYYVSELFRQGKVFCDLYKPKFHVNPEQTKKFIEVYLQTDGKVGIFCTHGKDRKGIFCMILEALGGASYKEIKDEFGITISNLYGIEKDTTEYMLVENMYINRELYLFQHFDEIPNIPNLKWREVDFLPYDVEEVFTKYLIEYVGVEPEKVQAVKDKLKEGL